MSKDKEASHKNIIEAAKKEFLEYGFKDSSMRRIAKNSGITAPALYKHFKDKEDMFAALVTPTIEEFLRFYRAKEDVEFAAIENPSQDELLKDNTDTAQMMEYLYDNIDEVKLIVCKSQGTKFEGFTHDVAKLEEDTTIRYMDKLKSKGISVREVNKMEFHLLVTNHVGAVFEAIRHDFTREEAMHYAKTLDEFYQPAWKRFFGLV